MLDNVTWQFNISCWRLPWHDKSWDQGCGLWSHFAGVGPFQFRWWSRAMMQRGKQYIGDGVYATTDSLNQILLQAQRGGDVESIALEPLTMRGLIDYARTVWPPELLRAVGIHVPPKTGPESKEGGT